MKKLAIFIFIVAIIGGVLLVRGLRVLGVETSIFSRVEASGVTKVEKRDVSDFKEIDVSGAFDVEIIAGKDFAVEVEADEAYFPKVKTEVEGDTLKIDFERSWRKFWWSKGKIKVRVSMPEIERMDVSGACKINASDIKSESFEIDSSGASKISVSGTVKNFKIDSSGASHINAENLKTEKADVNTSGASRIDVFVSNELNVDGSGASKITYSGEPTTINKDVSGACSVKKK